MSEPRRPRRGLRCPADDRRVNRRLNDTRPGDGAARRLGNSSKPPQNPMSTRSQRQETIRNLLARQGRLSVEELSPALGVTTMTIRRDLAEMEKASVLTRTHGGCVLQSPFVRETPFSEKDQQHRRQKLAIAREAARRLKAGSSVYLDTGTTAVQVARVLPTDLEIRVFTNNLRVAMELFGRQGVEVTVYGGVLAAHSPDLIGELALSNIGNMRVDVAIVGADALDIRRGEFYSADLGTAMLCRAVQRQAENTVVVMDSSKLGKRSHALAGRLSEAVTLITDQDIDSKDAASLRRGDARLILASYKSAGHKEPKT